MSTHTNFLKAILKQINNIYRYIHTLKNWGLIYFIIDFLNMDFPVFLKE